MFHRVFHEDWTRLIPVISFIIMFTVFLLATLRAIRLRPEERERLSTLPLDENNSER